MLEAKGLTLRLSGHEVLRSVDLTIPTGAIVGLIGPNGSGKTSLLESLAGFLPSRGDILWKGRSLGMDGRRFALFYIPDGIRPCPDHLAREVLEVFRVAYGREAARVDEVVESLDLRSALGKRVGALSKGLAKRLLLALGVLTRAPLLLLDEPLDGLDVRHVGVFREILRRLKEEGRTLLLSIHELVLAERLCERFLLIAEGSVLAEGDLHALRARAGLSGGGLEQIFLALA